MYIYILVYKQNMRHEVVICRHHHRLLTFVLRLLTQVFPLVRNEAKFTRFSVKSIHSVSETFTF